MIIQTSQLSDACKTILQALDNKNISLYNETLELILSNGELNLNVTNREYYCRVKSTLDSTESFRAAVNAKTFLSLISKITSRTIDVSIKDNCMIISGNGNYKLPLIYKDDSMLELPTIDINNVTAQFSIDTSVLNGIYSFNSKELQRGVAVRPVQSYYYVDDKGCITFTSGACVNEFTLPTPIKLLLSDKVVKLFKLFKNYSSVDFTLGVDELDNGVVQTKVKFETNSVIITAILADHTMISSVPVEAIRGMASKEYAHAAVVNKNELLQLLARLMIFTDEKNYGKVVFNKSSITVSDWANNNTEEIECANECSSLESPYEAILNLNNLNLILTGCEDEYITICYGDSRAIVIKKNGISDILPELRIA